MVQRNCSGEVITVRLERSQPFYHNSLDMSVAQRNGSYRTVSPIGVGGLLYGHGLVQKELGYVHLHLTAHDAVARTCGHGFPPQTRAKTLTTLRER